MAVIGSLAVNIVARTQKFTKGIGKSLTATQRFTAGVGRMNVGIGTLATGLASVVSVGALKSIASDLDLVAKTSNKLGVASQNLMGLRFAASQTGVSAGALDKALQKMVVNVDEAATGTGEARDSILKLGLSTTALAKLSPDEQFNKIAGAMQGVESETEKLSIAYDLFGGRGAALVNTLKLGEGGLKRMQNEAERLGIALSGEELKKVEAMNDALDRLQRVTGTFGQAILIKIAPNAEHAFNALAEAVRGLPGFSGGKDGEPLKAGERKNQALTLGLSTQENAKNGAQTKFWRWIIDRAEQSSGRFGGQLSSAEKAAAAKRYSDSVARTDAQDNALSASLAGKETQSKLVGDFSARFGKMIGGVLNDGPKLADTITGGVGAAMKGVQGEVIRKGKLSKQAEDMIASLMTPAERVAERMADVDKLVGSGALTGAQGAEMKKRLGDTLDKKTTERALSQLTARTRGSVETYASARRNLGQSSKDPMAAVAKNGEKSNDLLGDIRDLMAEKDDELMALPVGGA